MWWGPGPWRGLGRAAVWGVPPVSASLESASCRRGTTGQWGQPRVALGAGLPGVRARVLPALECSPERHGLAGIDGEKAPSLGRGTGGCGSERCSGQPGGAAPGREAQETSLIGPSARLHHIRGLGRAGGTWEALALQAPGSPASPRPACSSLRHPGCGLRALVPSGFPAAWEAFAASGVTNGHCSRSSRYFLGQGAPPSFGNAACQPPYAHLYSLLRLTNYQSLL